VLKNASKSSEKGKKEKTTAAGKNDREIKPKRKGWVKKKFEKKVHNTTIGPRTARPRTLGTSVNRGEDRKYR